MYTHIWSTLVESCYNFAHFLRLCKLAKIKGRFLINTTTFLPLDYQFEVYLHQSQFELFIYQLWKHTLHLVSSLGVEINHCVCFGRRRFADES
jgi:hypothetical protein